MKEIITFNLFMYTFCELIEEIDYKLIKLSKHFEPKP